MPMPVRLPWQSPTDHQFSWTTFWFNLAAMVMLLRFFLGDTSIDIAGFSWHPGEMESLMPAAILGSLGGVYGMRRYQEKTGTPTDERQRAIEGDA